jgi:hypothetical protein
MTTTRRTPKALAEPINGQGALGNMPEAGVI